MPHLKSFREYIEALKAIGEIQEIDQEVDWNLEMGAIIRRSYDLKAPAPLFNKIKDASPGFRALGAPAGVSNKPGQYYARIAVSLGLPPTANAHELIEAYSATFEKNLIPPQIIKTGPCKENILLENKIDLFKFPVPLIHEDDGGRYINTWGTIIVQTPDKSWTNWSIARIMLHEKNKMVGLVSPGQHVGDIHAMWKALNKPTPFALALGCEPAIPFVSGMPLPKNVNEVDFIGGYLGEPVQVVPCETVDLLVPATAEIIIEGYISNTEQAPEGPMGEYAGYLVKKRDSTYLEDTTKKTSGYQPVYEVTAITHRNNPILPVVAAGAPIEEDHTCWGLGVAATIYADLKKINFPVARCFAPFEAALHWLVVTVKNNYREKYTTEHLIDMIKQVVFTTKAGVVAPKIFLINNDIDPSNINEIVWAFATRCHPVRDVFIFENIPQQPLVLYLSEKEKNKNRSVKVIYNCLPPDDWKPNEIPKTVRFHTCWPEWIQEKVVKNWNKYGYD